MGLSGFVVGINVCQCDHEVSQLEDGGSERYDAAPVEQDVPGNRYAKITECPIRSLIGLGRH